MLANDDWYVDDGGDSPYACMAGDGPTPQQGLINTMMYDPNTVVRSLLNNALYATSLQTDATIQRSGQDGGVASTSVDSSEPDYIASYGRGWDVPLEAVAAKNLMPSQDNVDLGLTRSQQEAVQGAAQEWAGSDVPYVFGGKGKDGADCSGAVWAIYQQAGLQYPYLSSREIPNSKYFARIPDDASPVLGDLGVYPGHVVIYDPNAGPGKNVWSAFHTGGPVFGAAASTWFGKPAWYRYRSGSNTSIIQRTSPNPFANRAMDFGFADW